MKRRDFLSGIAVGLASVTPAFAQDVVSQIRRQLRQQGFREIAEERTLLGRVRIMAVRNDGRREIIINPSTGEILRDLWSPLSGGLGRIQIIDEDSRGSGGGDDESDDEDDDEDDDGEGGGGGGGSGSGGSGSGSEDDDDDGDDGDGDD